MRQYCPRNPTGEGEFYLCIEEACAWWDSSTGRCAVLESAHMLDILTRVLEERL